jgi:hypothetical protein
VALVVPSMREVAVPVTDDQFRCICDPDRLFEPGDPRPVAVEGCPAHRSRRYVQLWIVRELEVEAYAEDRLRMAEKGAA